MHEHSFHETEPGLRAGELLNAAAHAERRLLRQERKAEKRLAEAREALREAESRLLRARERVEHCRETVAVAEEELQESQRRRASGPAAILN
jgi:hypothetical protein